MIEREYRAWCVNGHGSYLRLHTAEPQRFALCPTCGGDAGLVVRPLGSNDRRVVGVPDTVTHEQYMAAIRSLGIDPSRVMSLHFHNDMIVCSVVVCDEQGKAFVVDRQPLTRSAVVRVVGGPS